MLIKKISVYHVGFWKCFQNTPQPQLPITFGIYVAFYVCLGHDMTEMGCFTVKVDAKHV
jgi:hypothetical protein